MACREREECCFGAEPRQTQAVWVLREGGLKSVLLLTWCLNVPVQEPYAEMRMCCLRWTCAETFSIAAKKSQCFLFGFCLGVQHKIVNFDEERKQSCFHKTAQIEITRINSLNGTMAILEKKQTVVDKWFLFFFLRRIKTKTLFPITPVTWSTAGCF